MRGLLRSTLAGAMLACAGAAVVSAGPAHASGSYSPYNETASAALARYVRTLASDPRDFATLIGAGRAALELGDAQAAAGFFARADEVNPRSPLPQAGMGAVSVVSGEPQAALPYFTRAQQLGATLATVGCDRGLAYDLLGRQADAQSDYRSALGGPDAEEARRRLALSLAISGNRAEALQTLTPLMAKRDVAAGRTRAFILALTGDPSGAMAAINAAMPGNSAGVAPFLQRLPGLQAGQKAAAVNLGIFPGETDARYAAAVSGPVVTNSVTTDRLAGIDQILRQPTPAAPPAPSQTWAASTMPASYAARPVAPPAAAFQPKIWLQLASGQDVNDLAASYRRLKRKSQDMLEGIKPYVARSPDRARLLIGPFRGSSDAEILSEDLQTAGISSFKWSSSQSDRIAPLAAE
jgi:tetratricopeptide (TPR) repeat protein